MEFLKELFENGALTFDELKAKVEASEKIKLANLKDGDYVAKDKFSTKETEVSTLKEQLQTANKQIEDFKSLDVESIKAKADEYKNKFEEAQAESLKKLEALQFTHAIENELGKAKAKNIRAVKALLELDKVKLDGDSLLGFKEQLDQVKVENPYLFDEEDKGTPGSGVKIITGKGTQVITDNPWSKETWNMTKQVEIYKADKDKAIALAAQHGIKIG